MEDLACEIAQVAVRSGLLQLSPAPTWGASSSDDEGGGIGGDRASACTAVPQLAAASVAEAVAAAMAGLVAASADGPASAARASA